MAECQKQTEVVLYACDAFCSLTNHELLWFLDIKGPSTGGGLKHTCRQLGGLGMARSARSRLKLFCMHAMHFAA